MLRVVSAFRVCHKWGDPIVGERKRYFTKEAAEKALSDRKDWDETPISYYGVFSCFLLEVQAEKGKPVYFDLGNPIDIER